MADSLDGPLAGKSCRNRPAAYSRSSKSQVSGKSQPLRGRFEAVAVHSRTESPIRTVTAPPAAKHMAGLNRPRLAGELDDILFTLFTLPPNIGGEASCRTGECVLVCYHQGALPNS